MAYGVSSEDIDRVGSLGKVVGQDVLSSCNGTLSVRVGKDGVELSNDEVRLSIIHAPTQSPWIALDVVATKTERRHSQGRRGSCHCEDKRLDLHGDCCLKRVDEKIFSTKE